ncbi:bifunctional precorrin-2 dehydrogenase/sirohydrochlorin ferrochelatase [Fulvivirga maritima]|uniref:precorrin-2 dehydrogenase/sirohydrochlorin ferrochelatase family protein n=1 Tax=Fulvivirga maritima TaxID=2904247 RepID=UPI001F19258B|nr:bifunctional precorrin-2 dehydrogenase/sirohydrochlorin ferrochelatase [Fulvivirga maritima]UII29163.1 bifunctional precorrin-2 dehydrogenase/sirohydrochlorin ferrochelatase [Fulvivirga maritima]
MSKNQLFPIFLKINQIRTLIVGGGAVGLEKLGALLKNNPEPWVKLVATDICDEIKEIAKSKKNIELVERPFIPEDLEGDIQLLVLATDIRETNKEIYQLAKAKGILTNVADTPDLCDFYLGSTVTKGDLKIGISTNGKSPTFAKRFREVLEEILPDETDNLIQNLHAIRNKLNVGFAEKVKILNERTKELVSSRGSEK